MHLPEQKRIIKRLVFRLVRRYIAGSTTQSVLEAVRKLNEQGLHATVTLLNDYVEQTVKARYNTNAYIQFIKQISRLNLNSDISLRLTQIGYGIDNGLMGRNLQQVIDAANENRSRVWIENEESIDTSELLSLYREFRGKSDGLGIEIMPTYEEGDWILELIKPKDLVKLRCRLQREESKKNKKESFNTLRLYKSYIDRLRAMRAHVTVLDHNAHIIGKIAALNKSYRNDLTFEAPLGYGNRKLKKLAEKKFNISVYVPYGKDWVQYLINKLTEGRIRNIAIALLNGEKTGYEHDRY